MRFAQTMLARVTDEGDPTVLRRIWAQAMALRGWEGAPCLVHADLHPLNMLTAQGRLTAVIDWGGFCAGDPAHDLICGWTMLGPKDRALAFSKALMAAPYYHDTNPRLRDVMRATLVQTMQDWPG